VDVYLDWIPLLAIGLGLLLWLRPQAAPYALPFLIAWCCSKLISNWINRSPHAEDIELSKRDRQFVREVALRTWRYFAEFSTEKNHWLIPDNVQEQPFRIAERISPTNLGMLLNARQAALELGFITLSEFAMLTERTLKSTFSLPRYHGHLVNWYDTLTLKPLEPLFISSVDSGNFVASIWSLRQGCIELLKKPIINQSALEGLADCHYVSDQRTAKADFWPGLFALKKQDEWLTRLFSHEPPAKSVSPSAIDLQTRVHKLREFVQDLMPWYEPEYAALRSLAPADLEFPEAPPTPSAAATYYLVLDRNLETLETKTGVAVEISSLAARLRTTLQISRSRLEELAGTLQGMADRCEQLSDEMGFAMLVDKDRNLLSIGLDAASNELNKSCYDLLASEARTATFIAVAKGEAIQDSWFRLGRQHTVCEKETVLISWTGTMFEYLMPSIWMKSHPDTLLDRATRAAVRAQQAYAERRGVPWGISEAAYSKTDEQGNYQYAAFGVPGLALNVARAGSLVVSPYSSCLALTIDPGAAVANLAGMLRKDWLSDYGFYESIDYTNSPNRAFMTRKGKLVRCWMAHHQGMSLAAICNLLGDGAFQRWFHADKLVQASELILQERPLRVKPITDLQPRRVTTFGAKRATATAASSASA
jgi:hypothetical protein